MYAPTASNRNRSATRTPAETDFTPRLRQASRPPPRPTRAGTRRCTGSSLAAITSAGPASRMRLLCSTAMRSAMRNTLAMSCRSPPRSLYIARTWQGSFRRRCGWPGDRARWSARRTSGSRARARAPAPGRRACAYRPTARLDTSSAYPAGRGPRGDRRRCRGSRPCPWTVLLERERAVLLDGERVEQRRELEHEPELAAELGQCLRVEGQESVPSM